MSIWGRLFRRKRSQRTKPSSSDESGGKQVAEKAERVGPVRLKTVSDLLKLVGMRVEFATKQNECFEGLVIDVSDEPDYGCTLSSLRQEIHPH